MGCAGWEPASRRWWVALSPRRFPSKFVRACRCTPPCSARTRFWRREKRKGGECQFRWHNAVTGPGRKKRGRYVRYWRKADIGRIRVERPLLTQSGHYIPRGAFLREIDVRLGACAAV